ncbi:MAG: hypothetical protein KIS73_27475, partial [Enhydrobacter sp.]|nr:hypothetical protein [Enhydrobacter sp.]
RSDAPAALVIGYVASLRLGGDEGLATAREVYDPLLRLVRRYRLSREQEHYLNTSLPAKIRGWGLADRLAKAAVDQWSPNMAQAGALTLSREYDHYRDLVDTALAHSGRTRIKGALLDPDLPIDVRVRIERKLEPSSKKIWWF